MENERQSNWWQVLIILAVVFFFLVMRFPPLRFLFMIILAISGVLFGVYALWRYISQRQEEMAFSRTEEGMVAARIEYCEEQIEKNKEELSDINRSIGELKHQMNQPDISARNLQESGRLIKAFHSEAGLRRQKISFFELCIGKLRRLSHNHQLTQSIAEKREKLELLKENHYEDLAALEELKAELEMSATYLETIETLSLRMLESTDYDDAKQLQLELEEMTQDLDSL